MAEGVSTVRASHVHRCDYGDDNDGSEANDDEEDNYSNNGGNDDCDDDDQAVDHTPITCWLAGLHVHLFVYLVAAAAAAFAAAAAAAASPPTQPAGRDRRAYDPQSRGSSVTC